MKKYHTMSDEEYLQQAHEYAKLNSMCNKVAVGCLILTRFGMVYGTNRTVPYSCKEKGCLRIAKHGTDSKEYRHTDCRAIHSEVNAIVNAAHIGGFGLHNATAFVTRYPCENCARVLVNAGIKKVVYGRRQEISPATAEIFAVSGVEVTHSNWGIDLDDTTR